ncbi:hypothetical protein [Paenibacillus sp. FSL H8-0537]|uniref:hypothetical protein n=1 Tax=Paenibacillus sp. FSL H8-0537 TaxID=2921399 RepID=UPI003101061D
MNKYPIGVTPEARLKLIEKFDLSDTHHIDWEYIVADHTKLQEFIQSYKSFNWNIDEKYALMAIIVASYDDELQVCKEEETMWDEIRSILITDLEIHIDTIIYWSLKETDLTPEEIEEDGYLITKRMIEVYEFCNILNLVGENRWESYNS